MEKQPNGFIPGIFAAFLILGIIFFAMVVKVFDSVSNSGNTPATSNSNRQNAPERPAATPDNYGNANRVYNSNMSSSSMNSNMDSGMLRNSNMSDNGMSSNSGDRMMNSNMKVMPKPASEYDYRVKEETELRKEASESGESIERLYYGDSLKMNYRKREDSKWYYVTAESGESGWIDGNYIEEIK